MWVDYWGICVVVILKLILANQVIFYHPSSFAEVLIRRVYAVFSVILIGQGKF